MALAVFFLQAGEPGLRGGTLPQAEHGGFGKGPRERSMTACAAGGAGACASRFSGTLDETTGGGTILPPREALDIMHLVEQHAAEERADPGDRLPQREGLGVMMLGGCDEGAFAITEQLVVVGNDARSTARLLGTAGSAQRSATPSRLALSAILLPMAGSVY